MFPFVVFSLISCRSGYSDTESQKGIANAEKLITAISTFYHDKNYYPSSLGELIPDYLVKLPTPRESEFNVNFEYELIQTDDITEYQLYFFSQRGVFFTTKARDVFVYRPSGVFQKKYFRGDNLTVTTNEIRGHWAFQTWSRKK